MAHPSNLWKTYFTSSKYVQLFRKTHGEPDVIEIRKVFNSRKECMLWEEKVLKRMNIRNNNNFLNRTDGHAPPITFGKEHHNYGKKWTDEQRILQSEKLKGNGKGIKKSKEHKLAISEGLRNQSQELREKRRNNSLGSKNTCAKITEKDVLDIMEEYEMKNDLPLVGTIGRNNRIVSYDHVFSVMKSQEYGVNLGTIKHIIQGTSWSWLTKRKREPKLPPS